MARSGSLDEWELVSDLGVLSGSSSEEEPDSRAAAAIIEALEDAPAGNLQVGRMHSRLI